METMYNPTKGDYARLDYYWQQHYNRFAKYVEKHGLTCQACGGKGGWTEPVIDFGEGPWEVCGWCEGTGKVTRWIRGQWLAYQRDIKRQEQGEPV